MKKITQELHNAIRDFVAFCLSVTVSNLLMQLVFDTDNIWVILAVTSVLIVIFNRLIERFEYWIIDKKNNKN